MYVIKKIEGKYLARRGSAQTYTSDFDQVAFFPTKESAELERCKDNEIVVDIGWRVQV